VNALSTEIEKAGKAIARSVTVEASQVGALREFNALQLSRDPSKLTWPASLPIELALKTATPQELREHYEYTHEEWAALRLNPQFIVDLTKACDTVKQEGMSFKMKAQLQAEGMQETVWRLVHAPGSEVPAAVKARLIETTFRVAGYDNKAEGGAIGNNLAIQINLGG
jgi:hypothetical protein